jgi:acetyltransferase-like isoleucine patch superfamily enzyme
MPKVNVKINKKIKSAPKLHGTELRVGRVYECVSGNDEPRTNNNGIWVGDKVLVLYHCDPFCSKNKMLLNLTNMNLYVCTATNFYYREVEDCEAVEIEIPFERV